MSENEKPVMPKKGFRNQKKFNKTQEINELKQAVQGLQMGMRIVQMGLQQLGTSFQRVDNDIANSMGVLNDLQYRTLAMLDIGSFNKEQLNEVAEVLKLKDFDSASDKEDLEKKYENADVVDADSIVIITSECKSDSKKSIFRSKFELNKTGNAAAIKDFPGKKVGDKFDFEIDKNIHVIEILGVRKVPAPVVEPAAPPLEPEKLAPEAVEPEIIEAECSECAEEIQEECGHPCSECEKCECS